MATMGLFKPSASSKAHAANGGESRGASYRAVEIRCPEDACEAAKAERGKRYLSKDAPTLPLSGCDKNGRCACRYRHHEDRRGKEDRRSEGPSLTGRVDKERRNMRNRRAEDRLEDPTVAEARTVSLEDTYYGFRRR
jgi:hypothetical protein